MNLFREVVYGNLFHLFKKIFKPKVPLGHKWSEHNHVKSFIVVKDHLFPSFCFCLADEQEIVAEFCEEAFIFCLYEDKEVQDKVGQEFLVIFDIFYAKAGTEAIAESFFRVVDTHIQSGPVNVDNLTLRAKIDWSMPNHLQAKSALKGAMDIFYSQRG